MRAKEEGVLEGGQAEGAKGVNPECDRHAGDRPGSVWVVYLVRLDDVLLRSRDDGGDG